MKSTPLTQGITMLILALYLLYGFFALPFAGLLLSLAVGLISYGSTESFEIAVSFVILSGVLYSLITRSAASAALIKASEKGMGKEGFADSAVKISERVNRIRTSATREPSGVYSSGFVEGFADAAASPSNASGQTNTQPSTDANSQATTKPAPAASSGDAGSGIAPPAPPAVTAAVADAMKHATSGFKGSEDDGLFKLGSLPSENKGGFHIDQGTTVINALNALKPDQVKAMTDDTKKLIETQKNLMGMLSNMKPMLQDGKQMMETFQEMFGNGKEFKLSG